MTGISIIHPNQSPEANAAFTPTREDIDYAQAVVNAFEDARARGLGPSLSRAVAGLSHCGPGAADRGARQIAGRQ